MSKQFLDRLQRLRRRIRVGCRGMRDDAGGSLVELGFMLSILGVPLMLGVVYMGNLEHYSIEISNAAHAGAMYGMRSSTYASNTSGITTASRNEASDFGTALAVTPTTYYACSNAEGGTTYTTQALAAAGCGTGTHTLEFLQVVATASVTPLGSVSGMASTVSLSSTSVMEVQE
jgi:Flp pilus assembly protein TadG